jgi:hypothetical protein
MNTATSTIKPKSHRAYSAIDLPRIVWTGFDPKYVNGSAAGFLLFSVRLGKRMSAITGGLSRYGKGRDCGV